MALNLFMLDQASRRAWRLGKREEVRIYYLTYANTAGHHKLRKLGQQSGAAAAFAGEPARGALIEHAGADKTTLARLSSLLEQQESEADEQNVSSLVVSPDETEVEQEEATLKAVFAHRAEELRAALVRGRTWLGGLSDTLEERLMQVRASADFLSSVWREFSPEVQPRTTSSVVMQPPMQREQPHAAQPGQEGISPHDHLDVVVLASPPMMIPAEPVARPPVPPASLEPTPVTARTVGSRADVIFGRSEHIALARVRRSRTTTRRRPGSHEPVKRHQPVVVREIAALVEAAEHERVSHACTSLFPHGQAVVTPSLWDQGSPAPEETTQTEEVYTGEQMPQTLFALPPVQSQTRLWR